MENEFVPYEQALVLKELGFDEMCLKEFHKCILITNSCGEESTNSELIYLYGEENTVIAAPLYQQAFRWFRENYGLSYYNIRRDYNISEDGVRSYDDVELECLKKLIEIVKVV